MVMEKQSTNEGDDLKWTCPLSSNGNYQVNTLRRKLDSCSSVDIGRFEWVKEIPIKVSTFIWRAKQERIPTSVALSKRGVNVTSTMCYHCGEVEETSDHMLIQCSYAKTIMKWILKWCNIQPENFSTVHDTLDYASNWGNCPKKKRRLLGIFYGTMWSIWKSRNDRVFNNKRLQPTKLMDIIMSTLFIWVKYKGKCDSIRWSDWCLNPFIGL
ncbi:uncharacterized protein LOC111879884 [Lactuca sativa]|uniref:uncharacterized protein LOC111879884 n=1 Tax=Lactuca sativa TaxID=4236 RepID=UPI000CD8121E|nr:uncharacterized protein LOC111879884 [Lactuca sativa]